MLNIKTFLRKIIVSIVFLHLFPALSQAQQPGEVFTLSSEALQQSGQIELDKLVWKFQTGDDLNWAKPDFDDGSWREIEGMTIKPDILPGSVWDGRVWFRLRIRLDENLAGKNLAFVTRQAGASEIYLDGKLLVRFGAITEERIAENNPNRLPIPFRFDEAGEHTIAVRYASKTFQDFSSARARWLTRGGAFPRIYLSVIDAGDLYQTIRIYKDSASMRIGFLIIGVLIALAMLHFLLYVFYRVERANLFYSIYAAAFAIIIIAGNLNTFGHHNVFTQAILRVTSSLMLAVSFLSLVAFLHIASGQKFGRFYWALTGLWLIAFAASAASLGGELILIAQAAIGLSFAFCGVLLVKALRERRPGAWILMIGVQIFAFVMLLDLFSQFGIKMPGIYFVFEELSQVLAVPIAVSVFLARNFARTSRDLQKHLEEVERLSEQKIEHERHAVELRAENERHAKELEEARQLQLSMLPKKLPQIPNLEIAAYMKPATEVGGDYYDFHVSSDQTLTIAVGDATGHGLKAGTMVTATKSLFNNLADEPVLPEILKSASVALKKMNLRGMFMAMTMARLGGNHLQICQAGMPPAILFRRAKGEVEEFSSKALPLGAPFAKGYVQQEAILSPGDCLVIMSDGFPEMFDERGEMIGFDRAAEVLRESASLSASEIVRKFVTVGEKWAGSRPADDDITFVVVKSAEVSN